MKFPWKESPLEFFDFDRYAELAGIASRDPEDFIRLNRCHKPAVAPWYKTFSFGPQQNACLTQRLGSTLMVAHVDCVQKPTSEYRVVDGKLYSPVLDNRLGVYLALEVLPKMGIDTDIAFTTDEEIGESTAVAISTRKQYNWLFSFDRGGDDAVCYQYECPALTRILEEAGFCVGEGSYSDIAALPHLGACGINFGNGMHDYHRRTAYCDLGQLEDQLVKFWLFHHGYSELWFPFKGGDCDHRRDRLDPFAVSFESILWQREFHLMDGDDELAFEMQLDLTRLLLSAPDLRREFRKELMKVPPLRDLFKARPECAILFAKIRHH